MGAVYKVRHRLLGEERVVKVLRADKQHDLSLHDRFRREAQAAIQLRHPNVVQLYDFTLASAAKKNELSGDPGAQDDVGRNELERERRHEGAGFIVMEFIEGLTLQQLLRLHTPSIGMIGELARQTLRALGYLHRQGFVHRDVATDNLMLTRDVDGLPLIKVIDLGIAKSSEEPTAGSEVFMGKLRYASPERFMSASDADIDGRADLYSFGIVLYELLTGQQAIAGHDVSSVITGHLYGKVVPFEVSDPEGRVPQGLRDVVFWALEKDRDARPQTADEMLRAIQAAVAMSTPDALCEELNILLDSSSSGKQGLGTPEALYPHSLGQGLPSRELDETVRMAPGHVTTGTQAQLDEVFPVTAVTVLDRGILEQARALEEELESTCIMAKPRTGNPHALSPESALLPSIALLCEQARKHVAQLDLDSARALVASALDLAPEDPEALELQEGIEQMLEAQQPVERVPYGSLDLEIEILNDEATASRLAQAEPLLEPHPREPAPATSEAEVLPEVVATPPCSPTATPVPVGAFAVSTQGPPETTSHAGSESVTLPQPLTDARFDSSVALAQIETLIESGEVDAAEVMLDTARKHHGRLALWSAEIKLDELRSAERQLNARELMRTGKVALAQKDYGAAVHSFRQAAELQPTNQEAWNFLQRAESLSSEIKVPRGGFRAHMQAKPERKLLPLIVLALVFLAAVAYLAWSRLNQAPTPAVTPSAPLSSAATARGAETESLEAQNATIGQSQAPDSAAGASAIDHPVASAATSPDSFDKFGERFHYGEVETTGIQ